MSMIRRIKAMHPVYKSLMGALIFFFLFTMVGFFALPPVLKFLLVRNLSEKLHREVTIEEIRTNPYVLSLTVSGFVVRDLETSHVFASFEKLFMNVQILSLFRWAFIVRELSIEGPYINIIRDKDGSYNFSDILKPREAESKPEPEPSRFSLNNIRILNGDVRISDSPKNARHRISDINIAMPFLSNLAYHVDIFVKPTFSARFNDTRIVLEGQVKPFADSLETVFDVNIDNIDITRYLAYLPFKRNFHVTSGLIDTKAKISYVQYRERNPSLQLTGDVTLENVEVVGNDRSPLLKLPKLYISIGPSELISKKIHLSTVAFHSFHLTIAREKTGKINILSLFPERTAAKSSPPKNGERAPLSISADEIRFADGAIFFSDFSVAEPFRTTLEPLDLTIRNFSTDRNKKSIFQLSVRTDKDEKIKLTGDFTVDPLMSEGRIDFKGIQLGRYAPYYKDKIAFDIRDANLDISSNYRYIKKRKVLDFGLSGTSASLDSVRLRIRDEKDDFLTIPMLSIEETEVDLTKRELIIGELSTKTGKIILKRSKNGDLNIGNLFIFSDSSVGKPSRAEREKPENPWQVTLKSGLIDRYAVRFEDLVPPQPATIVGSRIRVRVKNISTGSKKRGSLSLSGVLNKQGRFTARGTLGINPVFANLKVNLRDIDLSSLQPYFTDKVRIVVTDGNISTAGSLRVNVLKKTGLRAAFKGKASLSDFSSIGKAHADAFLKWKSLDLRDFDIGFNPTYVTIREIALIGAFARLIVERGGKLNLQTMLESETLEPGVSATPQKMGKDAATPRVEDRFKQIRIERVVRKDGHITFLDKNIKPAFSTSLVDLEGRISGLSSEEGELADVEIKGKYENYAPLEIVGKIHPLRDDLFVDLQARFTGIDLSPMTPYSGRYIGNTVEKGRLSLDLRYLIDKRKLDSENRIFLDQFTLGGEVKSPNAVNLPIELAIALLKDRKGEIKLDIPVTGSLDDPKFKIGRIIIKILVNIVKKAAASPFALMGKIIGSGEELSFVEFNSGSAAITEGSVKKLDVLTKALYERPSLRLEIEGHVDAERDRESLRQYLFNKKLKAQKLKDMLKKKLPAIPVDEVEVKRDEYEKYLRKAYKAEKFPKQKTLIGTVKKLPVAETEKLLFDHIEVSDDDLRLLALQRAKEVKDYILQSVKIEQGRIFLVESGSDSAEETKTITKSRVDFRLK